MTPAEWPFYPRHLRYARFLDFNGDFLKIWYFYDTFLIPVSKILYIFSFERLVLSFKLYRRKAMLFKGLRFFYHEDREEHEGKEKAKRFLTG